MFRRQMSFSLSPGFRKDSFETKYKLSDFKSHNSLSRKVKSKEIIEKILL